MSLIKHGDYTNILCSFTEGDEPLLQIQKLMALTPKQIKNPKRFQISSGFRNETVLPWNQSMMAGMLQLFQHYVDNAILWEVLEINMDHGGVIPFPYMKPLLMYANQNSLFSSIKIRILGDFPHGQGEYFFPGITQNQRLESLSLVLDGYTCESFTNGDLLALRHVLQTSKTLKHLSIQDYHGYHIPNIAQILKYLENNQVLESLCFSDCDGYDADDILNVSKILEMRLKNLQKVTLVNHERVALQKKDLERALTLPRLPNPLLLELKFGERPLSSELLSLVVKLRWVHPELWLDLEHYLPKELLFINRFHALGDIMPISLCPHLLQKAMKAGMPKELLFQHLKSPRLLGNLEPMKEPNWNKIPQEYRKHFWLLQPQ